MKVIVVSGARSNVGKTHLARALCDLLPGAARVKIGHHAAKPGRDAGLYPMGTPFATIAAEHAGAAYLVVESNSILEELTPDCSIYLPADDPKPSARLAREKADVVRGRPVPRSKVAQLAGRLGCPESVVLRLVELAGAGEDDEPAEPGSRFQSLREELRSRVAAAKPAARVGSDGLW